jgi:hypothetical protein
VDDADTQRLRAIAAALWPKLLQDAWDNTLVGKPISWDIEHQRDYDDYGDSVQFSAVCSGKVPKAPKRHSRQPICAVMLALLPDGSACYLTRDAYQAAYYAMTGEEQRRYYEALMKKAPSPYRPIISRGQRYYGYAQSGWDWNGSRHARSALHKIAAATQTPITAKPAETPFHAVY